MAKKIVKPTKEEQKIIDRRLREKYPQMFRPGWGKPKKKVKKTKQTKRTKQISEALKAAGLTDAELERLTGKRMKKTFSK